MRNLCHFHTPPHATPPVLYGLHVLQWATYCNNVSLMEHAQWVDELIAPDNRRTASKKAGLSESTLSRQLQRGDLPPESAIALCRNYDHSPVDGLVELGYLDAHEVSTGLRITVSTMTNQQISDILAAISEEILVRSTDDDSLRSNTPTPDVHPEWQGLQAVADSSPDHPEEDTDFD